MTTEQKVMLPAQMPTISTNKDTGKTMFFPSGVFGEWESFETLADCMKTVLPGMTVCLTVCDNGPIEL
jgi:hypothetical protein